LQATVLLARMACPRIRQIPMRTAIKAQRAVMALAVVVEPAVKGAMEALVAMRITALGLGELAVIPERVEVAMRDRPEVRVARAILVSMGQVGGVRENSLEVCGRQRMGSQAEMAVPVLVVVAARLVGYMVAGEVVGGAAVVPQGKGARVLVGRFPSTCTSLHQDSIIVCSSPAMEEKEARGGMGVPEEMVGREGTGLACLAQMEALAEVGEVAALEVVEQVVRATASSELGAARLGALNASSNLETEGQEGPAVCLRTASQPAQTAAVG